MTQECQPTREKPRRIKDKPLDLYDGKLVNRPRLGQILHCGPERISKMIHMLNGMPYIKIGARLWFDPAAVLNWFKEHEKQNNEERKSKSRSKARRG